MATGTAPSTVLPPPPPPPQLPAMREHERVVLRQLRRTSFHVRLVDLASSLLFLAGGVLVFLLLAALVDHWVISLGTIGRFAAMLVLTASVLFYLVRFVVPLLIRSINPTFAARTIEEAKPSLKNSLINFLLLRQDKSGIREVVYEAIEAKAASDVAAVPVEATVDRTRLIWAGYVLCGVLAVFAAYKIFSPKDPFQTVARVATPWADIARPSRVVIKDVQPGNAEVYHAQQVKVSAEILGVREGEEVKLLISTADGQTVNQPVAMKLAEGGLRYECILPPLDEHSHAAGSGMQQDMTYRMLAGDAETSDYKLTVVAAPTIVVDRVEYAFPPYTKRQPELVPQIGDLKAIEGTRVTIHATSNQPMKSAWIEFDPHKASAPTETMQLAVKGTRASGTLTMLLKEDRQTPWHASYQVRFYNDRGRISEEPILHKIDVIRDLAPEVQILQPEGLRIEIPEDGERRFEVRAVDPDFALTRLALEGTAPAKKLNIELLEEAEQGLPQATMQYVLRPREQELVAGNEVKLAAVAEDNRHSPKTGQPEPNVTRTAELTIIITPPSRAEQGGEQNQNQGEQNQRAGNEAQQQPGASHRDPRNQQQPDQQPRQSPNEQPRDDSAQGQPMQGAANNQQKQQPRDQQPMQPQENQQQSDQQQGESSQQGGSKSQDKNQSGQEQQQQGEFQSSPGGSAGSKSEGQSGAENMGESSPAGGGQSGASQQGSPQQGSPMNEDGQPAGAGEGSTSGQPSGNSTQQSGNEGDPSTDASGQPSEGPRQGKAHEGEAVEEVLKDLQREQSQQSADQQAGKGSRQQSGGAQQPGANNQINAADQQRDPQPSQVAEPGQSGGAKSKAGQPQDKPGEGQTAEGSSEGTQPGAKAKSGKTGSNVASGNEPAPNDQDPMADGQSKQGKQGEKQADKSPDPTERTPDDKQGQNASQQPSGGNKGGASQGAAKTGKEQPADKADGQEKDPGAGQTGNAGAGDKGTDKAGSGTGQDTNRDTPKEQRPDGGAGEKGEPSPPSNSKRQSDSKGGQSGDQSGGGKQGAGQSGGQKGNDSAGGQSAADEGAGAAQETGSGETGSQAGNQQQAAGKTGQSGDQAGDGSKSGDGQKGKTGGQSNSGQQPPNAGSKNDAQKGDGAKDGANQPGSTAGGTEVTGGGDGNRPVVEYGPQGEAEAGDAANLEYARKATEMALERLRDQEHNPDPELLDRLGWTKDDLQEFLRRWDTLKKSADQSPEGKREMDEALKSLGLRNPANRKRQSTGESDNQRDLRDSGSRSLPPAKYRDLFDAFRKGTSRSSE